MTSLNINLCGIQLKNPVIIASGILASEVLIDSIRNGAAAITTKTITLNPRKGHPPPNIVRLPYGFINAFGLRNPGIRAFSEKDLKILVNRARELGAFVFGSVSGSNAKEVIEVASIMERYGVSLIELNISCPTAIDMYSLEPDLKLLKSMVKDVKSTLKVPLSVKLSPNVPSIVPIAKAVIDAGADVITAINTLAPALVINVDTGEPVLKSPYGFGGLSGPAIKYIALAKVLELALEVNVPIIGIGGITTWRDAIEMIMVGATAIGILSAILIHGTKVVSNIIRGIEEFMKVKGYRSINDFRGLTLRYVRKS